MKPHMEYIKETISRKKKTKSVANEDTLIEKYKRLMSTAKAAGYSKLDLLDELDYEIKRINEDRRDYGDHVFQDGVQYSKTACINAINKLINELKGEN